MKRLVPLLFVTACVGPADVSLNETKQYLDTTNGEHLNGEHLNGEHLNGEHLNGEHLNGPSAGTFAIYVSLNNVRIDGVPLDATSLTATIFNGTRGAETFSGADFVGAEFDAVKGDNTTVTYRITEMIPGDGKASYLVNYLGTDNNWYPICGNTNVDAYPLNGTWDHREGVEGGGSHTDDPSRITFGCRGQGALAKCVDFGYLPWTYGDHHLGCVRMVRADYCRNGLPYTQTGRRINVYDSLGIEVDTNDWGVDGEWDVGGARCFTSHNRAQVPVPCFDSEAAETCGELEHFGTGTLLMTEIP